MCPRVQDAAPDTMGLIDAAHVAEALSRQARARLAEAPILLAYVKTAKAISVWKEKQRIDQEAERATWCAPHPQKSPEIYFAFQDEHGISEWLFCDGSRVQRLPGHEPELVPAVFASRKGFFRPASFLEAIRHFPAKEIRQSPRLPSGEETEKAPAAPNADDTSIDPAALGQH